MPHVLKYYCKYLLYRLQLAGWLHRQLFRLALQKNRKQNEQFRKTFPAILLPSNKHLFETYQPEYRKFIEDGALAAAEILCWTKPYLAVCEPVILDWGCGAGRIVRHIPSIWPNSILYACDTNEALIEWNKAAYQGITFSTVNSFPPLLYADQFFDLVYGFSVLTHIPATQQTPWIAELHRVIKNKGILLLTTHGSAFIHQLLPFQKKELNAKGIYTQAYARHGHRMMSTYHEPGHLQKILAPYFTVKEFFDGTSYPEKAGGQDVWILCRNPGNE